VRVDAGDRCTLNALGREDEKISNLRESMVSIERLLLFLSSEGRPADAPKSRAGGNEVRAA
jgi:magnesium transporter